MTTMQRILTTLIALVLLSCVGFAIWLHGPSPTVPSYPNQQQTQIRQEEVRYGQKMTATITTLETTDSWDTVVAYYKATLGPKNRDWRIMQRNEQSREVLFQYNEEYDQPLATFRISGTINNNSNLLEVITRFEH